MKKAQGLSMRVIIIAALALIVLVVLIFIFTGRIGSFGKGIDDTQNNFLNKCEIPGTQRKCETSGPSDCLSAGGIPVQGTFNDCEGTCCSY